jgi:hypothetical protein
LAAINSFIHFTLYATIFIFVFLQGRRLEYDKSRQVFFRKSQNFNYWSESCPQNVPRVSKETVINLSRRTLDEGTHPLPQVLTMR